MEQQVEKQQGMEEQDVEQQVEDHQGVAVVAGRGKARRGAAV